MQKKIIKGNLFSPTTRHQYYVASIWRGSHISFKVTGFHVGLYPGRILELKGLVEKRHQAFYLKVNFVKNAPNFACSFV